MGVANFLEYNSWDGVFTGYAIIDDGLSLYTPHHFVRSCNQPKQLTADNYLVASTAQYLSLPGLPRPVVRVISN